VTAATRLRRELQDAPAPAREPFLALVAQVIRVNPDYYSMWNYRKEAAVLVLGDTIQDLSVADAADSKQSSTDAKQTAALNAAIAYATPQSSSNSSATASSNASAADAAQTVPAAAAAAAAAEQQPSLTAAQIVQRELAITVEAFKRNPKSYSAWHHRRWVLSRGAAAVGGLEAYKRELELCAQVLSSFRYTCTFMQAVLVCCSNWYGLLHCLSALLA
jgi:Protein prenyltransferase alpha subunit repeat